MDSIKVSRKAFNSWKKKQNINARLEFNYHIRHRHQRPPCRRCGSLQDLWRYSNYLYYCGTDTCFWLTVSLKTKKYIWIKQSGKVKFGIRSRSSLQRQLIYLYRFQNFPSYKLPGVHFFKIKVESFKKKWKKTIL